MSKEKKFVVLGKYRSGKSQLLNVIMCGRFIRDMDDIWDAEYRMKIDVDGESFSVEFFENNEEEFSALRDKYMRQGDGFLAVYSITDRSSFEEVETKIEEVYKLKDSKDVPMVLVGNKCDLEDDRQVLFEEGHEFAERHGIPFFETSAKTSLNVNETVEALIRRCEEKKEPKDNNKNNDRDKKCIIQ